MNNKSNIIVSTALPAVPAAILTLGLATQDAKAGNISDYLRKLNAAEHEETPQQVTDPVDTNVDASAESYETRFESPFLTVRGEDPILNFLTPEGRVRGSYLLSGLFTLGSQQGDLDAGAVGGELLLSPFEGLERLTFGLGANAMHGVAANGKVGIDPLSMWQLDGEFSGGYDFDLGNRNEIDARAYLRGEWSQFNDRVNIDNGLGKGRGSAQLGLRLGVGADLGFGDLRVLADLFGTHKNMRGQWHGSDILGNIAEGEFGRDGISGMVELDLGDVSPRFHVDWTQYFFQGLEEGRAEMYKFGCPISGKLLFGDSDVARAITLMPYLGIRNRSLDKPSTENGMDELSDYAFGGAGVLVNINGIRGMFDLRYDGENDRVSFALSFSQAFGYAAKKQNE
ncbi:hypothetical protein KY329_04600 [Candidatus Woesearchaeota archaeon]|nr:hypothetical protein [Candidatus Woesearchaeota archaeon]